MYNLSTVSFALGKRRHHTRMIGSRVLSDYQNGICDIEVFEFHCPLAYSERFNECSSRTLMTKVAAIGKVVGSEFPNEELI